MIVAAALGAFSGTPAYTYSTQAITGYLLQVGPAGRSLLVGYTAGGCQGAATAAATETSKSIDISLRQRDATPHGNAGCTSQLLFNQLTVHLRARLNGRLVLGLTEGLNGFAERMPNLVGLRPLQALALLTDITAPQLHRIAVAGPDSSPEGDPRIGSNTRWPPDLSASGLRRQVGPSLMAQARGAAFQDRDVGRIAIAPTEVGPWTSWATPRPGRTGASGRASTASRAWSWATWRRRATPARTPRATARAARRSWPPADRGGAAPAWWL